MSGYTIKFAETDAEIRGRGLVHCQSWHETYAGLIDPGYLARMTPEKCVEIAFRFRDNVLIAKDGERVVGFAAIGEYRDGSLPDCGEIYALYMLREYQDKGIGLALMNAAIESLWEFSQVALWVLKGNEKAIRFYEKCGFCADGTETEVLLGTPNAEIRMVLPLKTP